MDKCAGCSEGDWSGSTVGNSCRLLSTGIRFLIVSTLVAAALSDSFVKHAPSACSVSGAALDPFKKWLAISANSNFEIFNKNISQWRSNECSRTHPYCWWSLINGSIPRQYGSIMGGGGITGFVSKVWISFVIPLQFLFPKYSHTWCVDDGV